MRHRKAGVKLNRTSSHRKAMFRNMVTSLFKYERIQTTDAKAKELRRWADHIVTLAKRGDLHARRQALSIVREKDVVHKLFAEAAERFGAMEGGYTRIVKIGRRRGDAAPLSIIELVGPSEGKPRRKRRKKKREDAAAVTPATTAGQAPEAETQDVEKGADNETSGEAGAAAEEPSGAPADEGEAAATEEDDAASDEERPAEAAEEPSADEGASPEKKS